MGETALSAATAYIESNGLLSTSENVIEFPREIQRLTLCEIPQRLPQSVIEQVEAHLRLRQGWDGHSARQLRLDTVLYAFNVLAAVCKSDTPPPSVVPTHSGGLQFEWHRPSLDLEIVVRAPAKVDFYAHHADGDFERELSVDFRPVLPWIDKLS